MVLSRQLCSRGFIIVLIGLSILISLGTGCSDNATEPETQPEVEADYDAPRLSNAPTVDGDHTDEVWQTVPWGGLAYWITGDTINDMDDFSGRYKIGWTEERLYILVEITDDDFSSCFDNINAVSNDDCVVIFLDEDRSGGSYQSGHQAFAYFIEIDSTVVGFSTGQYGSFAYFDDHVEVAQIQRNNTNTWELAVDVFTDGYSESIPAQLNPKATLESGKVLGLTVAYFDADFCRTSCMYGSNEQETDSETMIWENADHFGAVQLIE